MCKIVQRMLVLAIPAVAFSLAAAAPAKAQAQGSFERTLKVTGPVDLEIRSGSGSIRVTPGSGDTVKISARIRSGRSWFSSSAADRIREIEKNPPIAQSGNSIRVGGETDRSLFRNISISYDVTVPSRTRLDARTGSGSVDVGDLEGAVEAHSGSGSLDIGRVAGPVVARTGSGSIDVRGAQSLEARAGSGSIKVTGIAGAVTAHSGSGAVRVEHVGRGDLDVSSSSGHVTVTGVDGAARVSSSSGGVDVEGRPSGPWDIHSSSGSIVLRVPKDAAFELDARVSSGGIDLSHPVTLSGRVDRRRVQGQVRGGGPLVAVRSSSGGITIE
ncbi:MAG TPA: DUF4097 family beta strand repeat-containing protein [Vicinamibacterales bacterium]|nr:DUF4097 family beta strand repeat protein [Acidobacteriota bacterium]HOC18972.1 DUF4097 family beta strand repeat-containing protein [Vicinamibacterales bacterium]